MIPPCPGDHTAPALVYETLRHESTDVLTFSLPNFNPQEQAVFFEYLHVRVQINGLVLPLIFDTMRKTGIRDEVAVALQDPATSRSLAATAIGQALLARYGKSQSAADNQDDADLAALRETDQQRIENALNRWLAEHWAVWRDRGKIRGELLLLMHDARKLVLQARNALLRIDSSRWTVDVPAGQYAENRAALEALLLSAKQAHIPVLLYIAPRPTDAYFPFDPKAYTDYKADMAKLAEQTDAELVNLEDAVRGDVWGKVDNGVGVTVTDVYHFKAEGHRQLAAAILQAVETIHLAGRPRP